MKCSLYIFSFPEEISSFSHSIVFLYFLYCSLKKAFLSLLAILCNSAFSWVSFPLSLFLLFFFPQIFVRPACFREGLILTPYWIYFCDFNTLFLAFLKIFIITYVMACLREHCHPAPHPAWPLNCLCLTHSEIS